MKTHLLQCCVLVVAGLLLFAGCSSSPRVDWNARVGNFTYNQAVLELGPPNRVAKLSDGQIVADWVTGHRQINNARVGTGVGTGGDSIAMSQSTGSGFREIILRLTFGADGKLTRWTRNW